MQTTRLTGLRAAQPRTRPFAAASISSMPRFTVECAAQASRVEAAAEPSNGRRQALLAAAALLSWAPSHMAQATLCIEADTEAEGDACRRGLLARDADSEAKAQSSYGAITASEKVTQQSAVVKGVPVSVLDDKYVQATRALKGTIEAYATLDVYDKQRPGLVKQLKGDASAWVSKYAPGGSARKLSARRMYVAVDAVMGHIASAGLAPLPASKFKVVEASLSDAATFLADGR